MRKFFLVLSLILIGFSSACSKYDIPKCDFDNASQDLLWLKDIIDEREANPTESMKYCYISQGKLKRKPVFILGDCNPAIDKVTFVLDCEGDEITDKNGNKITLSEVDIKDLEVIWLPENFACNPI